MLDAVCGPVGKSWRVDKTYIRIRGQWCYLYRAVDKRGRTVDFRLSEHRDIQAAKAFFRIRKGQFNLTRKPGPTPRLPMQIAWNIALA